MQGYQVHEIAGMTDRSLRTVERTLQHCRQQLTAFLTDHEQPPPPPRRTPSAQWIEREKYVEGFEAARAADPHADFIPFLPPAAHPLYVPVLEELVRIDLEQHWLRGEPRWLEDYLRQFPQLLDASASVRTLAFEEFRLRRRAGQSPTADEYKQRFGIDPGRGIRDDRLDLVPGPRTPPPRTDRFAQVMAALPHVGDQFLDYRLWAELGAGSFGRAFLAERPAGGSR